MGDALLSGLRFVEIAHPLTEYAGLILAGLGAEVLLVEPPGGAITRQRQPRVPDSGDSTRGSCAFLARNGGKRSVVIDPELPDDRQLLAGLIERADAVLACDAGFCNLADLPGVDSHAGGAARITITDRFGLGTSSIVGFAASGGLSSSGWPHQPPCNAPSWLALDGAGIYAATMALVACIAAQRGGGRIDYSIAYEQAAIAAVTPWTRCLHSYGMQAAGQGVSSARLGAGPYAIYEASDGYVRLVLGTPKQWRAFVELLGSPEELADGAWDDPSFRAENFDALILLCAEYTRQRTVADLFHTGQQLGLTITPINTLRAFADNEHVRARGLFVEVQDPEFGPMRLQRPPLVTEPADLVPPPLPAPALNEGAEHARQVLTFEPTKRPSEQPTFNAAQPLAGIRVLELGVGAVVPEAASFLALLGGDVIKVESAVRVDFLRQMGLGGFMDVNNCPTFNQLNLGVRSLAVDMSSADGVALVRKLTAHCDVIMENMRGPVVGRWGLDWAGARQLRPDIVHLSSQGLGTGPYDGYQTYGPNLQTFSGVTSQWAHPDDPYPVGTTLNHPDHTAGKQALLAVLGGLLRRDRGDGGCRLDATQMETPAYLIADRYLAQQFSDADLQPAGNSSPDFAPHGCYPCADDRWLALAVEDSHQWQALAQLVAAPPFDDPALADVRCRLDRRTELDAALAQWTATQPVEHLEAQLRAAGVPASRVVTGDDMAAMQAAHDDGFFGTVSHPTSGLRTYTGAPVVATPGGRPGTRRPPLLGEHTDAVLFDLLGIDSATASALHARGSVGH